MKKAALLALALLAVLAPPARSASPRPLVLVYGDSLVREAQPYLEDILANVARVDFQVVGAPGAALCDVLPGMRADASHLRPAVVVIDFSGNDVTPCMQDGHGHQLQGQAVVEKYRADLVEAIALFRPGAPQIWLGTAPISLGAQVKSEDGDARMAAMEHSLAHDNPRRVRITEAGNAVLDHGWWTATLPCLQREPCTGGVDAHGNHVNRVRSIDGTHFCPVPYAVFDNCPVYASGGERYALGLLVVPLRARGWYDEGRASLSLGAGWSP